MAAFILDGFPGWQRHDNSRIVKDREKIHDPSYFSYIIIKPKQAQGYK